jgi:DNA end-binding protein Ku
MEFRIMHKGVLGFENFSFATDLVKLTKSAKNRSYPNLSNCHQAPLKEEKFCATCHAPANSNACTHKMFKMGKDTYPISADHLKEIKKQLDDDRIVVQEFRDMHEIPELWFTDEIYAAKQHKKYTREYREYAEILSRSGKVAVGEFVVRERPYPVMIYAYQGHLVLRALHYYDEVDPMPTVDNNVPVNDTKIGLLLQAVNLNKKESPFDIARFENIREAKEEELIEKVLKGEALPVIELQEMKVVDETDEIARLQALLAQQQAPEIKN